MFIKVMLFVNSSASKKDIAHQYLG